MSKSGPSISLAEFRNLLKDDVFLDYFNKFICLPTFSQLVVFVRKRQKVIIDPPLPQKRYSLNYNGLIEWLWRKRLPLFLRSRLYSEYRLCHTLVYHSQLRDQGQDLDKPEKRVIHDALKLLQTKCLGKVSAMRKFRKFLYKTPDGYKLYLYWLDTERLYFHIKRHSSASMDVFNNIKETYFARNSESKLPQQLLDAALQNSPNNVSRAKSGDIKTYDITFMLYLQKLCASHLKRYWMPRYIMGQNPRGREDKENTLLTFALKYLHGGITLSPDSPISTIQQIDSSDSLIFDDSQHTDKITEWKSDTEINEELQERETVEQDKGIVAAAKASGRKGVSFSEHPPPGVSSSSSDDDTDIRVVEDDVTKKILSNEYESSSSEDDEEEYKKKFEARKARARQKKNRSTEGGLKLGVKDSRGTNANGQQEAESSDSEPDEKNVIKSGKKKNKKRSKESSGGSDSAESWEGVHEGFRKKKGGKKFRYEDRHRRRSIHKRRLRFEELLLKESYRRPSMSAEQAKLFSKAKPTVDQQKILLDDEFDRAEEILKATKSRSITGGAGVNLENIAGGRALLKAALKLPSVTATTTSRMSFSDKSEDVESQQQDSLFSNRSPSMWDLSLNEISERLNRRESDVSSSETKSRMNLLGKISRRLHRSPSQDSNGSTSTVVQSSTKKRRNTVKIKPKKTKVTTLTFSLSGEEPTSTDKCTRTDIVHSQKAKQDKVMINKQRERRQIRMKSRMISASIAPVMPLKIPRGMYTMEKDYQYRKKSENKMVILALKADICGSNPFRSFLLKTDNQEMVYYIGFWQDVEKSRDDYEFGSMSFSAFVSSVHGIISQYILPSSPCRIEAPESLRQETIIECLKSEMQEMPWQLKKLQMETMEDLKYAHEQYRALDIQSFRIAAAFRTDETNSPDNQGKFLPPLVQRYPNLPDNEEDAESQRLDPCSEIYRWMMRALRLVMELNIPDGRQLLYDEEDTSEDSDDEGLTKCPLPPKYIRPPPVDLKELASRSSRQYPDPNNPLGLQSTVKVPFDGHLQSATLYRPIKRGGHLLKRPTIRPKNFNEVMKDKVHFEFFKRYLKAYRSDSPVAFLNAVENLRTADKQKSRTTKARYIIKKYFHNPKIHATKMLQCNADIIKEIPYLDIVTTTMLFSAQAIVARNLEERWFRRYAETFEETNMFSSVAKDSEKSLYNRNLISRNNKLKRVWRIFNDFIRRAASFMRSMRKQHMYDMFKNYLEREMDEDDGKNDTDPSELVPNRSESTILPFVLYHGKDSGTDGMKQRIINGQLVTFNFLCHDLEFWREIECYKTMADCTKAVKSIGIANEDELIILKVKATLIVTCYLESDIPPKLRVNIPSEVADITIESLQNGLLDRALFHEATIYAFPLLLHFWKKFCAEHYRYVPTLSKKYKRIYGLKMTPVIAAEMRKKPKESETTQDKRQFEDKKAKSKRIATADLPNYLDMSTIKFSKRRGSPFGADDKGPRLTFSIRNGVTLIEPVRRRKFLLLKGGSPDVRVVLDGVSSSHTSRVTSQPKRAPIEIPVPRRSNRRTGLLDLDLLQHFASSADN